MKKIKKTLKTIIWTIVAFVVGIIVSTSLGGTLTRIIPYLFALIAFVLCLKGILPGTDIKMIIELPRKKTQWYFWQFSLGAVFLFVYLAFLVYNMFKEMNFNVGWILLEILFIAILMSFAIWIWENRKEINLQIKKRE